LPPRVTNSIFALWIKPWIVRFILPWLLMKWKHVLLVSSPSSGWLPLEWTLVFNLDSFTR
jgi:hypothetical protein